MNRYLEVINNFIVNHYRKGSLILSGDVGQILGCVDADRLVVGYGAAYLVAVFKPPVLFQAFRRLKRTYRQFGYLAQCAGSIAVHPYVLEKGVPAGPFFWGDIPDKGYGAPAEIEGVHVGRDHHLDLVGVVKMLTNAYLAYQCGQLHSGILETIPQKRYLIRPDKRLVALHVDNEIDFIAQQFLYLPDRLRASVGSAPVRGRCHYRPAAKTLHGIANPGIVRGHPHQGCRLGGPFIYPPHHHLPVDHRQRLAGKAG